MLQKIRTRLSNKLVAWQALSLLAPAVLSVTTFGLVLYVQTVPKHSQVSYQKTASKKSVVHHVSLPTKVIVPAPAAPKVVAAPPSSRSAVVSAKTAIQAGTPKPEPIVAPSPSSSVTGLTPTTPAPSPTIPQTPSTPTTTGYTSTNWSGYLAANGSFTAVSGTWTATNPTGNGSTTSADSTWIGIGGVTTSDLIQIGTQNIITASGKVSTAAFYELLPNVSQPVPGVTITPGDNITASVIEVSSGQWTISLTDNTDKESYTSPVSYASSLSSAEWIEEDPSFSFRRQIPFDNFQEASFTDGSTIVSGKTVSVADSSAQPVTMVNNVGQTVAVPSAIGSDSASFSVSP